MKLNELTTDLLQLGTSLDQTIEGDTRGTVAQVHRLGQSGQQHLPRLQGVRLSSAPAPPRPAGPTSFCSSTAFRSASSSARGRARTSRKPSPSIIRNQRRRRNPAPFPLGCSSSSLPTRTRSQYGTVGTIAASSGRSGGRRSSPIATSPRCSTAPLAPEEAKRTFGDGFEDEQAPFEYMMEGGREVTEQDRLLYALCRPDRLLDLARRFTLFDLGVKKVARYQQFFAVQEDPRTGCKQRDAEGRRRGGVIWHTQGSGKSLTMVMLARGPGARRRHHEPARRAGHRPHRSRRAAQEHLRRLRPRAGASDLRPASARACRRRTSAAIITTVINKFDTALNVARLPRPIERRVPADRREPSRPVRRDAHADEAVCSRTPAIIGFTGTPLMKKEKSTAAKFGGLNRYRTPSTRRSRTAPSCRCSTRAGMSSRTCRQQRHRHLVRARQQGPHRRPEGRPEAQVRALQRNRPDGADRSTASPMMSRSITPRTGRGRASRHSSRRAPSARRLLQAGARRHRHGDLRGGHLRARRPRGLRRGRR